MNYTKELLEKNRVKFTVEVSADEWRAAIDEAYNKNKGKFQIEGFRKGKAPRKVIESVYGVGVFYEDAMDIILPKTYGEILDKESELFPVDSPEIDIDAISDSTFKYTATVQLKPDVKLGAFKGLKFTRTVKAVTDEASSRLSTTPAAGSLSATEPLRTATGRSSITAAASTASSLTAAQPKSKT